MSHLNLSEVAKRLDHASLALTIADMEREDAPLIYANAAFSDMTGYPPSEILNRNCRFLQGSLDNALSRRIVREALAKGNSAQATFDNIRRDGSPLTTLLLLEPLRDRKGRLLYMVGSQFSVKPESTKEAVGMHSRRVSAEIDHLLDVNRKLRANTRKSLAISAVAAVQLYLDT